MTLIEKKRFILKYGFIKGKTFIGDISQGINLELSNDSYWTMVENVYEILKSVKK